MKKSPVRAQRADEAEIAHRSGVPENRVRIILRCNAVPREDEVARLERVFGREDIQEYRAAKVATNAPTTPVGGHAEPAKPAHRATKVAANGGDNAVGGHSEPKARPTSRASRWRTAMRKQGLYATDLVKKLGMSRWRVRLLLDGEDDPTPSECAAIDRLLSGD